MQRAVAVSRSSYLHVFHNDQRNISTVQLLRSWLTTNCWAASIPFTLAAIFISLFFKDGATFLALHFLSALKVLIGQLFFQPGITTSDLFESLKTVELWADIQTSGSKLPSDQSAINSRFTWSNRCTINWKVFVSLYNTKIVWWALVHLYMHPVQQVNVQFVRVNIKVLHVQAAILCLIYSFNLTLIGGNKLQSVSISFVCTFLSISHVPLERQPVSHHGSS